MDEDAFPILALDDLDLAALGEIWVDDAWFTAALQDDFGLAAVALEPVRAG